jgi:transglutaminase-like putative cysteine protease
VQRISALIAIIAMAIAIGAAFGRILQGHVPTYRLLAVGVTAGIIAWATERRGMLLATTVSVVGLSLALAWLLAPQTTWFGTPTLETVRTLGSLAEQVGSQARQYGSPAPATPPLILAGVVAVWASIFSCYALAFRAQSPILSLLPPLVLVAFADGVLDQYVRPIFGVAFLVAALAVLFADSLRRIRSWGPIWGQGGTARDRLSPRIWRNGGRVGLTVLAAALVAPVVVPGFGEHLGSDLYSVDGDGRIKLAPFASLGAVLNDPASATTPIFQIRADRGSYWRMIGLDHFDGATWEATEDEGTALESAGEIPDAVATDDMLRQRVTVEGDLGFPWLIAAADPVSIVFARAVRWHGASSSLQVDPWPDRGEEYLVTSSAIRPTVSQLRDLGVITSPDPSLLALPAGIPTTVTDFARYWTAGQPTSFDQVVAIERHLRSAPFIYDETVAYPSDPAVLADILTTTNRGFCQQFASLMAVMLRKIGIPARVALGFTQGTKDGRTWTAMAGDLHTWVEVPFPGYGWLSFDPTPGGAFHDPSATYETPVGPYGKDCSGSLGCGSSLTATPTPTRAPTPTPTTTVTPGARRSQSGALTGSSNAGASSMGSRFGLAAVTGLLLVGLAIGVPNVRSAHRRRRRRRTAGDPRASILVTFDLFAERARALGWGRRPDETVEEFRRRLISRGAVQDAHEPTLTLLASTVSAAAYGGRLPSLDDASLVERGTVSLLQALRATSSWHRRLLSAYR